MANNTPPLSAEHVKAITDWICEAINKAINNRNESKENENENDEIDDVINIGAFVKELKNSLFINKSASLNQGLTLLGHYITPVETLLDYFFTGIGFCVEKACKESSIKNLKLRNVTTNFTLTDEGYYDNELIEVFQEIKNLVHAFYAGISIRPKLCLAEDNGTGEDVRTYNDFSYFLSSYQKLINDILDDTFRERSTKDVPIPFFDVQQINWDLTEKSNNNLDWFKSSRYAITKENISIKPRQKRYFEFMRQFGCGLDYKQALFVSKASKLVKQIVLGANAVTQEENPNSSKQKSTFKLNKTQLELAQLLDRQPGIQLSQEPTNENYSMQHKHMQMIRSKKLSRLLKLFEYDEKTYSLSSFAPFPNVNIVNTLWTNSIEFANTLVSPAVGLNIGSSYFTKYRDSRDSYFETLFIKPLFLPTGRCFLNLDFESLGGKFQKLYVAYENDINNQIEEDRGLCSFAGILLHELIHAALFFVDFRYMYSYDIDNKPYPWWLTQYAEKLGGQAATAKTYGSQYGKTENSNDSTFSLNAERIMKTINVDTYRAYIIFKYCISKIDEEQIKTFLGLWNGKLEKEFGEYQSSNNTPNSGYFFENGKDYGTFIEKLKTLFPNTAI